MGAGVADAIITRSGDDVVARLAGEWVLGQPAPQFVPLLEAALAAPGESGTSVGAVRSIAVDAPALGAWDSSLLIFLRQAASYCDTHDCDLDTSRLPVRITRLLALASA